ncbi:MAG: hypothetical protein J0J15_14855, partial [Mesorhizobium sp.]|nr:hypothetical protein [Mesorhizobium sp.]
RPRSASRSRSPTHRFRAIQRFMEMSNSSISLFPRNSQGNALVLFAGEPSGPSAELAFSQDIA